MRFEIKAGGAIAILIGLGCLSGGVFVLGLVAGYEVGRQQETTQQQLASVYSLPSAPEAESSPAAAPEAAAGSSAAPGLAAASPLASPGAGASEAMKEASAPQPLLAPPPSVPPPAPAVPVVENRNVETPPSAPPVTNAASSGSGTAPEASTPPAEEPAHRVASTSASIPRRKGYNIQIQAVMDKNGADEMVGKLQRMGYQAYTMHTEIGGQTWYRVRVGPYATEAEARAAEERLHEEYAHSTQ